MTYSKETTIWCDGDGCQEWVRFSTNRVSKARSEAETRGWSCSSSADYCPGCAAGEQ